MADFGWAFVKGGLVSGSAPPSGAVQFNNNGNFGGSQDLVFTSGSTSTLELTGNLLIDGDLNVSGTLAVNEFVVNVENRNVINISATGSTQFGDSTDDTHIFTGSMEISAASNPLKLYGVQSGTPPNTSSYLALDSNYNLVLTSAAGADSEGGTIGDAEDGTYTDGLFSDFLASTPIGTAIDRFNEILSIIVPGPAPAVDRINYTNTNGIETKLSFDASGAPSGYTAVGATGSFDPALSVNDQYTVTTSGEDFRLGVYDGTQEVTGVINFNVAEQLKSTEVNYSNDAFGNGESGSLNLYLNETLLHTLNLDGFTGTGSPNTGSASDLNLSGSGFFDVSISASARDQNGSEYDIFQHRTAKFVIDPNDQNKGWNYAKIEHEYGSATYITNFIQWFNDTDASSQAMSVSNQTATFTGQGSKYLSGVQYFRSASIVYNAEVANAYKYTYPTGNVLTFNRTSNINSIVPQSLQATDGIDSYNKVVEITGSTNTNNNVMLDDSTTISINLTHPLKTNLSTTGSVTTDEILIYNRDTANSNTLENFELEDYRLQSNAYSSQTEAKSSSRTWDSESEIVGGKVAYQDGLMFYNSRLYSPKQGPSSGDFSTLTNGPTGNPDYSSASGTRTFYRKLENTTGSPVYDLKVISTKNTKINNLGFSTDNVRFFVKIPGTTGWMDISQPFGYGNIGDNDGALINGASDNENTSSVSTSDSTHCITFGTASVADEDYVIVKIEADVSWTRYIETLEFQLGASDDVSPPTQSPALDDVDSSNSGNDNAKLSFGTSNPIDGFMNVEGDSTGSMSDIDSNERYRLLGDRRGVFSSKPTLQGTLNQDVGGSGNNYPDNSFGNAYTGSLVLEVNGSEVHEVSLESSLNAVSNDFNPNSSGFSISAVSFSETSDGIPDYNKPYRTGTYQVGANDQNVGWNYARVIHRAATDLTTNYVEWVVDTSSSVATSISSPTLTDFGHSDVYYQSGIGYFASNPTASFSFSGSNFYNNVYQNGDAISFPTTSSLSVDEITGSGTGLTTLSVSSDTMNMPALNNTPDCELTNIVVTASVTYTGGTSISGGLGLFTDLDASVSGRIIHPFKTSATTTTIAKTAFMRYSGSIGDTTLTTDEHFGLETYRIVSGNYVNQAAVTSSSNTWNPQTHMDNGGSHDDGMVTANGFLISPLQIGVAGDASNSSLQAPSGNPDYSNPTEDIRTYYRYFYNNTGTNLASITLTLYGDAELVSKEVGDTYYAALGANKNINIEIKSPTKPDDSPDQSTGWGDAARAWSSSLQPSPTNDGAGIRDVGGGDEQTITTGDGLGVDLTFGNRRISAGSYYVIKISAHKNWTGYISRINIS